MGSTLKKDITTIIKKRIQYKDGESKLIEKQEERIKKQPSEQLNSNKFLIRKSIREDIKTIIKSKREEKKPEYKLIMLLKEKYHKDELNEIPKFYRKFESLMARYNKEAIRYIEEFLEITEKLEKLNNKLSNREKQT